MEKILVSAIHVDDGKKYVEQPINIKTGFVIAAQNHAACDVLYISLARKVPPEDAVKGFLTSNRRFVDKREALTIALAANQVRCIETAMAGGILISEDLIF